MKDFLAHLETDGGKLAVIIGMIVFLTVTVSILHITHHDPGDEGRKLIQEVYGVFIGPLVMYLKPSGAKS